MRGNLFGLIELLNQVGEATLSAILPVLVVGHEDTATTILAGTLSPQTGDLSLVTDLVILQSSKLNFLMLVLDLLGSGVILLLALLAATTKAKDQVQGGLCKASRGKSIKIWLISLDRGYAAVN